MLQDLKKLQPAPAQAITCPTGRWVLVGRVPVAAAYERKDGAPLTLRDIETITHCGPGFARACRARTYASEEEALAEVARAERTQNSL